MHPEFLRGLAEQRRADLARSAARPRRKARPRAWRLPGWAARAARPALPALLHAGTEAHGMRLYLTPAELCRLEQDCARLLRKYAARADHPERRPAGAVGVEVAVLGRRLPEAAGGCRGLPGVR